MMMKGLPYSSNAKDILDCLSVLLADCLHQGGASQGPNRESLVFKEDNSSAIQTVMLIPWALPELSLQQ